MLSSLRGARVLVAPVPLLLLLLSVSPAGRAEEAPLTIEEAIRLAPQERYFAEQRRRFTGERAADDRPPQPGTRAPADAPVEWGDGSPLFDPDAPQLTL